MFAKSFVWKVTVALVNFLYMYNILKLVAISVKVIFEIRIFVAYSEGQQEDKFILRYVGGVGCMEIH